MADGWHTAVQVFLSAGSNIEPEQNLRMACRALRREFGELCLSSVYRNKSQGFEADDFLNMVIGLETGRDPMYVQNRLEGLHKRAGRVRGADPFSSRTLDLDVLVYGKLVQDVPNLKLPRDDIEKYSFVAGPLAEVAPDFRHPRTGQTFGDIWEKFDRDQHPLHKIDCPLD